MPTYKIEGQIIERTIGKLIKEAQVTMTVTINVQTIQETQAKVEQDNLPTDFKLAFRPSQEPDRVKIPVTIPGSVKHRTYSSSSESLAKNSEALIENNY